MNQPQIFNFEQNKVRTILVNDEPYFVGKDVAEILGYERADNAIRNHVDDEDKLTHQISASGQNRNMTIINESGLYSLILKSKLPSAKKFKRWVTSEVLPTIRKTGSYSNVPQSFAQALRLAADLEEIGQKGVLV
ncbi:bro family toxin-antitoxin system, toxin component [Enterococcus xinjiangensis]|nr:bro family toxin-antitoxin system, toxin component [Enterococcus lactis]